MHDFLTTYWPCCCILLACALVIVSACMRSSQIS